MKFGLRTPSLKKSISARTSGRAKRAIKKAIIPGYEKKEWDGSKILKRLHITKFTIRLRLACLIYSSNEKTVCSNMSRRSFQYYSMMLQCPVLSDPTRSIAPLSFKDLIARSMVRAEMSSVSMRSVLVTAGLLAIAS